MKTASEPQPNLWAIAGPRRGAGYSTLTAALAGYLIANGYSAYSCGLDLRAASAQDIDTPPWQGEKALSQIFSVLDANFSGIMPILIRSMQLSLAENLHQQKPQVLLDVGGSLSHSRLDVFLAADIKILLLKDTADFLNNATIFLNYCCLRQIEYVLCDHSEPFSDYCQKQKLSDALLDPREWQFLSIEQKLKLQGRLASMPIWMVRYTTQPVKSESKNWLEWSETAKRLFPRLQCSGFWHQDSYAAELVSLWSERLHPLHSQAGSSLLEQVEQRLWAIQRNAPLIIDKKRKATCSGWPYSIIHGKQILNLASDTLEEATQVSSALWDEGICNI